MKICNHCHVEQPLNAYHKDSTKIDGLSPTCKMCRAATRSVMREMLGNSRSRAKRKGWDNNLTAEGIVTLRDSQDNRCVYCGIELNWVPGSGAKQRVCPPDRVSLDRIDSTKGYTVGNVQLTCDFCNRFKYYYPEAELLDYCRRVIAYRA